MGRPQVALGCDLVLVLVFRGIVATAGGSIAGTIGVAQDVEFEGLAALGATMDFVGITV